jgi:carbonic anhydrase
LIDQRLRLDLAQPHDHVAVALAGAAQGAQSGYDRPLKPDQPLAVVGGILSCADSRIAPEYAFDAGRGDLFVCRVAGNFLTADNLASFEFAVDVLKTPLILVLGHEACGAIKATISSIKDKSTLPGHLPSLVAALTPAVEAVTNAPGDLLVNATNENVRRNVEAIRSTAPILSAAVGEKRLLVVGGVYHLATGQVEIVS